MFSMNDMMIIQSLPLYPELLPATARPGIYSDTNP